VTQPRTPSQTVGPFFGYALPWPAGPQVVPAGTAGAIRIHGRVLDGAGEPVSEGLIETWQVGPGDIRGFGRCPTDAHGDYAIITLKPPALPGPGGTVHAPQLAVSVFARGLLKRVVTRIYFPDEPANQRDPVLAGIRDASARATLIARADAGGYRFDIRLQGPPEGEAPETVFFDV
jgi:protocatechuate 3,4-dioxygenase, alpha subunit